MTLARVVGPASQDDALADSSERRIISVQPLDELQRPHGAAHPAVNSAHAAVGDLVLLAATGSEDLSEVVAIVNSVQVMAREETGRGPRPA